MVPGPTLACMLDLARGPGQASADQVEPTQPFDADQAKAAAQAEERRALCRMREQEAKQKKAQRAQEADALNPVEAGSKNGEGESSTENEDAFFQAMKQIEQEHRIAEQDTVPAGMQRPVSASPGEQAAVVRAAQREEDGEATINYADAERNTRRVDSGDPVIRQFTQEFDAVAGLRDPPPAETAESPRYPVGALQDAQAVEHDRGRLCEQALHSTGCTMGKSNGRAARRCAVHLGDLRWDRQTVQRDPGMWDPSVGH